MDIDELAAHLPVLGEPVPIELANTRYRDGDDTIEFLAGPAMAATWFAASPTARHLERPGRWTVEGWRRLVALRDTVDVLLRARIAGTRGDATAVAHLNATANAVTQRVELRWERPRDVQVVERREAADPTLALLGFVAIDTIALLSGPDAERLRVCANADCELLFLKQHHRRRWCHDSCGHRHRQAAYYSRTRPNVRG